MFFFFPAEIDENSVENSKTEFYDWNLFDKKTKSTEIGNREDFVFENLIIEDVSSSYRIDENLQNTKRFDYLNSKISPIFISMLLNDEIDCDITSEAEKLLLNQLTINRSVALEWFNDIYIRHYSNEKIVINLLKLIGNIGENTIQSVGKTMALAALNHKNTEIKELGVRAFENWGSLNSYTVLASIKVESAWLQKYIDKVLKNLETELCLS